MKLLFVALVLITTQLAQADDNLERYTGGAQPADKLPLLVALHGFGSDPDNIVRILDGLAVRARIFAPHGLYRAGDGWSWFDPAAQHDLDALVPDIAHAADVLTPLIADEAKRRPTCGVPIVVGFSQGGFMSYALAARGVVSAAFPLSGFLPSSLVPKAKPKRAPPIHAFHGEADTRVRLELDRATNRAFVAAGYTATLQTYPGVPHTLTQQMRDDVRNAIETAVRQSGCAR